MIELLVGFVSGVVSLICFVVVLDWWLGGVE